MNREEINNFISKVNFEKEDGLVPVIVQDASNNNVLMQAFMDKEALSLTLSSGRMHFWSRTKGRIWMKGEESNHFSLVENALLDCDNDSILFKVQQVGAVCHTGEDTCFYKPVKVEEKKIIDSKMLERLFEVIKERISNPSESSYVSYLTSKGENAVLQKIGEESTELILAIKSNNSKEATYEAADLFFHILVSFAQKGYSLNSIFEELELRHKKKTENLPQ
ncbi:bifunctional phosphoribosyl-AMP cyclohydrolase/phosphoribosyl-ATP diphosphatase HisIE [Candidatus Bathyarchaeota archaeon]|nr:bifunctional phosphoribosyl-AMP cyclohydrolase/phosphoribosyl-ATP diphosphatase HisIE [Candidatus Bathyarchaeota archaeon]